jgi:uncharacterized repeat protein (TIGR04138 family)
MTTSQVMKKIEEEIVAEKDTRYKIQAYSFVLSGLEFYLSSLGEKRHVSGQELSKGLLLFALKQFGLMAQDVLKNWGITKTDDFGFMVYNMIEIGVMSRQPDDAVEHFFDVVDFDTFFKVQHYFDIDKDFIKKIKGA